MKIRVTRATKDLSTTTITILAIVIIFVIVIAVGWFREGGLTVFDNPGSAADWFAAIGTWMIGFGATKFAANNYQLQLHERRERLLQDAESRLATTKTKLARVTNWPNSLRIYARYFEERPLNAGNEDFVREMLEATKKELNDIPWENHDMIDLIADDVLQLRRALLRANNCQRIIEVALDGWGTKSAKIDPAKALKEIANAIFDISTAVSPLEARLAQQADDLQKKRDHICTSLEREAEKLLKH